MISFLNDKYKNLGRKKFLTQASILCFLSDIGNITYINIYWLNKRLNDQFLANMFAMQGVDIRSISDFQLMSYKTMLINSLGFMFMFFMAYHCIVYYKMARNKLWAKKYVHGYALTGTILTVFEIPALLKDNMLWALLMVATTFIYIYTFAGIRYFKKDIRKSPRRRGR